MDSKLYEKQSLEQFINRTKDLKKNPKTYRTYSYSVRAAASMPLILFGNTILFTHVPTRIAVRFNSEENDPIYLAKPTGIKQDYWKIVLEWEATDTDDKIEFIAGYDFEFIDINEIYKKPVDLLYLTTPAAVDSLLLGIWDTSLYSDLWVTIFSDIDAILSFQFSFDGVNFDEYAQLPIAGGMGEVKFMPVAYKFVKILYNKAVAGAASAALRLCVRAKVV